MIIPMIAAIYRRIWPAQKVAVNVRPLAVPIDRRMDALLAEVGKFYNISVEVLKSPLRDAPTAHARQVAYYFAVKHLNISMKQTGRLIGLRDHTSVLHGIRKIEKRLDSLDENLALEIATIKLRLKAN